MNIFIYVVCISFLLWCSLHVIEKLGSYIISLPAFLMYSVYNLGLFFFMFSLYDFPTAFGIFVSIETTLWFSCNVDKLFSFNQFYRHSISILGSDILYNIPGLKCIGFYVNDKNHNNFELSCNVTAVFGEPTIYDNAPCRKNLKYFLTTLFENANIFERIKLLDSKYLIDRIGEQIDDVIALRNYAGDWHKVYDIKNRIDLSNLFSYNYNYLKTKHSQFILRDII